jgi:hypothetical protein
MNKQKMSIVIFAVVGIAASLFIPWFKAFGYSKSGSDGDGIFTAILYVVPLILSLVSSKTASFGKGAFWATIACGILASIIGIYEIYHANSLSSALSLNPFGDGLCVGTGLYLEIIAGIMIAVFTFKSKETA